MALSEQEQKILADIERQLSDSDPRFARRVGSSAAYRHVLSSSKAAVAAFALGLVLMIALVSVHPLAAFAGFAVMLYGAVVLERNLRAAGQPRESESDDEVAGSSSDSALG